MTKAKEGAAPGAVENTQEAGLNTADELNQLKAENEALKASLERLNQLLAEKEQAIEDLAPNPVFKLGKKSYELTTPKSICMFNGVKQLVTAETLKSVDGLLKYVVDNGYQIFKEEGA
jgi:hypothetical protein